MGEHQQEEAYWPHFAALRGDSTNTSTNEELAHNGLAHPSPD